MVPPSLVSNTLASLYMKQGHPELAIAVLKRIEERQNQRKAEFLTQLLTRVSLARTERDPWDSEKI